MLLKKLCDINSLTGDEGAVRDFIKEEIKDYVDEIKTDYVGNLIAIKKGKPGFPKVIIAGHMDEIGLMINSIDEAGFLKFLPVGGVDPRILVSKSVIIGDKKIPGVIGAKAIHLQTPEEREIPLTMKQLYIDIGAKNKADAEKYVKKGDFVAFDSEYVEFGDGFAKAKAFDDRLGCAGLIEILKETYDVTIIAAFTVQEEIGLRGATVVAYATEPDFGIALDSAIASDVVVKDDDIECSELGKGPVVSLFDSYTLYDRKLADRTIKLAQENNIPVQARPSKGGLDAGAIQLSRAGVPCIALTVPTRYVHSGASVINLSDYDNFIKLNKIFLKNIKEGEFINE